MTKLNSLQALRFFAAFAVVLDHVWRMVNDQQGGVNDLGAAGVDVFFVISGFIIVRSTLARRPTVAAFIKARWTRIAPIYLLLSLPWFFFDAYHGGLTWQRTGAAVLFWPVYDTITVPPLVAGWTLCFEALFYACVALALTRRNAAYALLALFAACWIGRIGTGWPIFRFLGSPMILEFLAGVGLAFWWDGVRRPWTGVAAVGVAISLVAGWVVFDGGPTLDGVGTFQSGAALSRVFWFAIPAACLVYGALQYGGPLGPLSYLGDASYSLYLVHPFMLSVIGQLAPNWIWLVLTAPAASVLASVLLYRYVEKPLLTLTRKAVPSPVLA